MAISFDTATLTFRKIMGNGLKYSVPRFQRDYSWDEEHWEDLWQDIVDSENSVDEHYMGYLLLQNKESNREYTIIDGQQRITTTTIIILSALNILKQFIDNGNEPTENKLRFDRLKETYIGFTDPVSLTTKPKLTLNRNNEAHFRNFLCDFVKPPVRGIKSSERLLSKAQDFFIEKIKSEQFTTGESLASFVESLADKLLFTQITVGSDLNAYKVFETLNARGVKLSTPDLIKNYLFSIIDKAQPLHTEEIRKLEEMWEAITSQLGREGDFSRFIHVEWNSRNTPLTQKTQLFKTIKQKISTRELAFPYLQNLLKSSEVYAALEDANDVFWNREIYRDAKPSLRAFKIFNITQPHGLLIAAYQNFDAKQFVKITGYIEAVSIRYNVFGQLHPNVQEKLYNRIAHDISNKNITKLSEIKKELKVIYPDDENFIHDFEHKYMRTSQSHKKARYILARIEEYFNSNIPVDDEVLTLEHVLPKNPDNSWNKEFSSDEMEECIELIGNMTLLQRDVNEDTENKSYSEKKVIYNKSQLNITKKFLEYKEWNKEAILSRQKWLAEHAVKVRCWRIDFD